MDSWPRRMGRRAANVQQAFFLASTGDYAVYHFGCTACTDGAGVCTTCKTGFTQRPYQVRPAAKCHVVQDDVPCWAILRRDELHGVFAVVQTCSAGKSNNCEERVAAPGRWIPSGCRTLSVAFSKGDRWSGTAAVNDFIAKEDSPTLSNMLSKMAEFCLSFLFPLYLLYGPCRFHFMPTLRARSFCPGHMRAARPHSGSTRRMLVSFARRALVSFARRALGSFACRALVSVACRVRFRLRVVRCASVHPSCTSALIPRGMGVVVHRDFVAHPTWGGCGCPLRVCALLRLRVCAPVMYFGPHPAWGGCRCAPRLRRSSHMGWVRLPSARLCAVTSARLCARHVLRLSSRVGWLLLCTATSSLIPRGVGAVALCASVRCASCAVMFARQCAVTFSACLYAGTFAHLYAITFAGPCALFHLRAILSGARAPRICARSNLRLEGCDGAGMRRGLRVRYQSFHRAPPFLLAHKPFLVTHFDSVFYLSFRPAAKQIFSAIIDTWRSKIGPDGETLKYEDDAFIFRFLGPFSSGVSSSASESTARRLLPLWTTHQDREQVYFVFLGFLVGPRLPPNVDINLYTKDRVRITNRP
ncbi:hypothetical protein B0H11DRAFT_2216150 [Mycena galericulata]|nr:hypothetical protein B0H11DRAFT_2216150 [Mycena galericulata]